MRHQRVVVLCHHFLGTENFGGPSLNGIAVWRRLSVLELGVQTRHKFQDSFTGEHISSGDALFFAAVTGFASICAVLELPSLVINFL